jgi:hypothetical protein
MSDGEYHAYVGLLVLSALVLSVLAIRGFGQSASVRVADGLFSAGFLGYAAYLIIADPETVTVFFYAFLAPVLAVVHVIRSRRAGGQPHHLPQQQMPPQMPQHLPPQMPQHLPRQTPQSMPQNLPQPARQAPFEVPFGAPAADPSGYGQAPSGLSGAFPPAGGTTFAVAPTHQPGGYVTGSGTMPSGLRGQAGTQPAEAMQTRPSGLPYAPQPAPIAEPAYGSHHHQPQQPAYPARGTHALAENQARHQVRPPAEQSYGGRHAAAEPHVPAVYEAPARQQYLPEPYRAQPAAAEPHRSWPPYQQ